MESVIKITYGEILYKYDWDLFCEVMGINPWCLNEGLANSEETVTLRTEEAYRCGIFPEGYEEIEYK